MDNSTLVIICYFYATLLTLKYATADKSIQFSRKIKNTPLPSSAQQWLPSHPKLESTKQQQQQPREIIVTNSRRLRSPTVIFPSAFDDILDFSTDVLTQISTIINDGSKTTAGVTRPASHLVPPRPGRNIAFRPNYQSINQKPYYYPRTMLTLPHTQRLHEFRPKRFVYSTQRPLITVNHPLSSNVFDPSRMWPSAQRPLPTNIFHPVNSALTSSIIPSAIKNPQRPLPTNIFSTT